KLVDVAACWPAKASEFVSCEDWSAQNHDSGNSGCTIRRSVRRNQWPVRQSLVHARIAAHVLVWSCVKVLAVTVPWQYGRVDMIQSTNHATSADFPMPCPELVTRRIAGTGSCPLNAFRRTSSPMPASCCACHVSGPVCCARGPGSPHG